MPNGLSFPDAAMLRLVGILDYLSTQTWSHDQDYWQWALGLL